MCDKFVTEISVRECVKKPVDHGWRLSGKGQGPDFQKILGKNLG